MMQQGLGQSECPTLPPWTKGTSRPRLLLSTMSGSMILPQPGSVLTFILLLLPKATPFTLGVDLTWAANRAYPIVGNISELVLRA